MKKIITPICFCFLLFHAKGQTLEQTVRQKVEAFLTAGNVLKDQANLSRPIRSADQAMRTQLWQIYKPFSSVKDTKLNPASLQNINFAHLGSFVFKNGFNTVLPVRP
jgi:hypothetical protein